jgi:hypothetical protein
MCGGDLGHRAGGVTDRCADLGAQPAGGAGTARDLFDGLGERSAFAVVFPASSSGLVPPQQDSTFPVRDVLRYGAHARLDGGGEHPARGTCRGGVLIGGGLPDPRSVSIPDTRVTCTPGSPNSTVVLSITPWVLPTSECFATSRLQEAKGIQLVDALNTLRFRVARSSEEPLTGTGPVRCGGRCTSVERWCGPVTSWSVTPTASWSCRPPGLPSWPRSVSVCCATSRTCWRPSSTARLTVHGCYAPWTR